MTALHIVLIFFGLVIVALLVSPLLLPLKRKDNMTYRNSKKARPTDPPTDAEISMRALTGNGIDGDRSSIPDELFSKHTNKGGPSRLRPDDAHYVSHPRVGVPPTSENRV